MTKINNFVSKYISALQIALKAEAHLAEGQVLLTEQTYGPAIAQAVSRRLPTAAAQVQTRV
jgi:hypothetical protein